MEQVLDWLGGPQFDGCLVFDGALMDSWPSYRSLAAGEQESDPDSTAAAELPCQSQTSDDRLAALP